MNKKKELSFKCSMVSTEIQISIDFYMLFMSTIEPKVSMKLKMCGMAFFLSEGAFANFFGQIKKSADGTLGV